MTRTLPTQPVSKITGHCPNRGLANPSGPRPEPLPGGSLPRCTEAGCTGAGAFQKGVGGASGTPRTQRQPCLCEEVLPPCPLTSTRPCNQPPPPLTVLPVRPVPPSRPLCCTLLHDLEHALPPSPWALLSGHFPTPPSPYCTHILHYCPLGKYIGFLLQYESNTHIY